MNKKICAMTDCNRKIHARFLCGKHYQIALKKEHFEPEKRFKATPRIELHRKYTFGGNYYKTLERDKYKCSNCGLTNYRHKMLYGRSLHIHHVDKKGSQVLKKERNNNLDNLLTLCWSCHSKADSGNLKKYMGYTLEVENNKVIRRFV